MSRERLSMRKIKEVLRLKYECHLTNRQIAKSCQIARSSVADYLNRFQEAGSSWLAAQSLSEADLVAKLFSGFEASETGRPVPDYSYIHNELRSHKNVTLALLWEEYKQNYPQEGYQYSQFCEYYQRWRQKLDYCMRQIHKAGEKVFVDYCDGLSIVDEKTGQGHGTELFVAVWGASNYTYAQASMTQKLPCWISSHVSAFQYFGCVPYVLVPDCLKSGVSKACLYEPDINPTYAEMAAHYGIAVIPARPRHPRDKAKVEAGVLIAQRWILAALRHRTFFNLVQLNSAIQELLERLNTRPLHKLKQSRRQVFNELDRPHALNLPSQAYEYAEWRKATVNIDYHIEVDNHYYSVPFQLLRQQLDVRLTANTLEVLHKGERVAVHPRSYVPHTPSTLKEHMPQDHQKYLEWTPSRILDWAAKTGPDTRSLVQKIIASRVYPEQGYRSCLGILRLGKRYGKERLEAASRRAVKFNACSFKAVRSILAAGLDRQKEMGENAMKTSLPLHENVRGQQYYT